MKNYNVTFNDLTERKQLELLRENKKEVLEEASKSQYMEVRLKVVKDLETTSEILEKMLEVEEGADVIGAIIHNPRFQKTKKSLIKLSKCPWRDIREEVAGWKEMSNEIFEPWLEREKDEKVIWAIIRNPSFKRTDRSLVALSSCPYQWVREEVASWEEMTNEIFEPWLEREDDAYVIRSIINNPRFKRTGRNLRTLSKCHCNTIREKVASWEEMTNEIFEQWIGRETDAYVIEKIINNPNFEKTEGNLRAFSKCPNWQIREKAAGWKEMTSELLESWLKNEKDVKVIKAIITNPNFKKEGKTQEVLEVLEIFLNRRLISGEMINKILELVNN